MTSDFIPLLEPSPTDAPTRRRPQRSRNVQRGRPTVVPAAADNDRALIQRLLLREPAAWREFVQRYERLIGSRIVATCREAGCEAPSELVEECCGEVMATLFQGDLSGLRQFQGRSKLSTWLAVIVRRTTLGVLRQRERDRAAAIQPDSRLDLQMVPDKPQDEPTGIDEDDRERLRKCLQQLSPADRRILELQFAQKWSYAEIAELLGISENAIGPKLHRAQARLKKLMIRAARDRQA